MITINQNNTVTNQDDMKNKITNSDFKLLQANNQYTTNGNHNYMVDECFKNNDLILPITMIGQSTASVETKRMKELCDKVDNMSMSTMHSDKDSRRYSDPDLNQNFSAVMMKRWEANVATIPTIDQHDIQKDCPLITQVEVCEDTVSQHAPEFS